MLKAARRTGVTCYVFGSHHIDWDRKSISGYVYDDSGWKRHDFPFPAIVYDRLPNRRIERLALSVETKSKLQAENVIWFNPGFFDKGTIHEMLKTDPSVKHYLPMTIQSPGMDELETLLKRYQSIYLKPKDGSLGNGIQQIIKRRNDPYYYIRFRKEDTNRLRRYSSLKRLIRKQFPAGLEDYLAQQGIQLLSWNGDPIDFRVHTNRNREGEWEVSALAAKLAGSNSITTHITSGGKTLSLSELIHDLGKSSTMVLQLKEAAIKISKALTGQMEGIIGEIGFDLGVDEQGDIWMFEANAKPGRSIFSNPNLNAYDKKTVIMPFEFCLYLFENIVQRQVPMKQ